MLQSLARGGELLYTAATHWTTNQTDWREWLDASAYDGVSASLISSVLLSEWSHPILGVGEQVLVGKPGYSASTTNVGPHLIETWTLDDQGKLVRLGATEVTSAMSALVYRGGWLAGTDSSGNLKLFDATYPAELVALRQINLPGCLWPDVEKANGSLRDGFWLPLGYYGVFGSPVLAAE
jgi:hypothetical protein